MSDKYLIIEEHKYEYSKNDWSIKFADQSYDEAIELATELGLEITDAEIIRTNSTGLVIYNPKNLAERIKGMKNTEKTREQKIAERVAYMQQQQNNSDNLN